MLIIDTRGQCTRHWKKKFRRKKNCTRTLHLLSLKWPRKGKMSGYCVGAYWCFVMNMTWKNFRKRDSKTQLKWMEKEYVFYSWNNYWIYIAQMQESVFIHLKCYFKLMLIFIDVWHICLRLTETARLLRNVFTRSSNRMQTASEQPRKSTPSFTVLYILIYSKALCC